MYFSAFSVVEVGFYGLLSRNPIRGLQDSFGFSQLPFSFHNSVAAFHFIQVHAVFFNPDQVHFSYDPSFCPLVAVEKYV